MKNMAKKNEVADFLSEIENEKEESKGNVRFPTRDTLKTDRDVLYKDYLLEGFSGGIEGNYGMNTAVRVIEPAEGRRQTLWLSGYEQDHLNASVARALESGHTYPMQVTFLRHKDTSESGREYNRFSMKVTASGEDITVPPVPEDQYEEPTEDAAE